MLLLGVTGWGSVTATDLRLYRPLAAPVRVRVASQSCWTNKFSDATSVIDDPAPAGPDGLAVPAPPSFRLTGSFSIDAAAGLC